MSLYDNQYARLKNRALLTQATNLEGFLVSPETIRRVVLCDGEFTLEETGKVLDCRQSLRLFHKLTQNQYVATKRLGLAAFTLTREGDVWQSESGEISLTIEGEVPQARATLKCSEELQERLRQACVKSLSVVEENGLLVASQDLSGKEGLFHADTINTADKLVLAPAF